MDRKGDNVKSVIVLSIICLLVSTAVVGAYQLTKPYIERSANKATYEAIELVLPQVEELSEVEISQELLQQYNCTFLRKSADSSAVAIQIETKGYQNGLVVMVGITSDMQITGVRVVQHGETEGIGTKAMTESYLGKFVGKSTVDEVELVSGATYTSNGIRGAVETALKLFETIRGELKS